MRDKFLTEAMGGCWHDDFLDWVGCKEDECSSEKPRPSFDSWQDFGRLWEWAQEQQEWFECFIELLNNYAAYRNDDSINDAIPVRYLHPDRFANALYEFLKERT